jgi:hypothetical protein
MQFRKSDTKNVHMGARINGGPFSAGSSGKKLAGSCGRSKPKVALLHLAPLLRSMVRWPLCLARGRPVAFAQWCTRPSGRICATLPQCRPFPRAYAALLSPQARAARQAMSAAPVFGSRIERAGAASRTARAFASTPGARSGGGRVIITGSGLQSLVTPL